MSAPGQSFPAQGRNAASRKALMVMPLPWPGSRDRFKRTMTWCCLTALTGYGGLIGIALLPMGDLGGFLAMPFGMIVFFSLLIYAGGRGNLYHPFYQAEYREWLKTTPWRPGMKLPLGPVSLGWLDALYLAIYLGMLYLTLSVYIRTRHGAQAYENGILHWDWIVPGMLAAIFLILYSYDGVRFIFITGHFRAAGALGLALGCFVCALPHPAVTIPIAVAMVAICAWGQKEALRAFPWEKGRIELQEWIMGGMSLGTDDKIGRLYHALSPKVEPTPVSPKIRLGAVLVTGWWLFAALHAMSFVPGMTVQIDRLNPLWGMTMFFGFFLFWSVFLRLSIYLRHGVPPIGLWGRLLTGRWIVPGYDRVFVAPLAALAAGAILTIVPIRMGAPPEWAALAWVVSWSILLLGGPSLRSWRLTANCRLATQERTPRRQPWGAGR